MTPEERTALHAAMYQPDEPEPETDALGAHPQQGPAISLGAEGRIMTVTVNGRTLRLPSIEYVQQLERTLGEMQRQMGKLNTAARQARQAHNKLIGELNDTNREVSKKINMRDLP